MELQNLLSAEEIADLRQLAQNREWVVLLKLLRNIKLLALEELAAFKDPNDAIARQGKVSGITFIHNAIESLYNEVRNPNAGRNSGAEERGDDPGSAKAPAGPVY